MNVIQLASAIVLISVTILLVVISVHVCLDMSFIVIEDHAMVKYKYKQINLLIECNRNQ